MNVISRAIAAAACAAALSLALTGCFGRDTEGADTPVAPTETTTVAATTAATTAATAAYPFTGYVNASTLHVRPSAGTDGDAIGGLQFGDAVTVTDREGDWYRITFKNGIGYVSAQYVQDTPPVATTAPVETTTAATDATVIDTTATDTAETTAAVEG